MQQIDHTTCNALCFAACTIASAIVKRTRALNRRQTGSQARAAAYTDKAGASKFAYKPRSVAQALRQAASPAPAIIYLGLALLPASCSLPGTQARRAGTSSLLGLAPRGGCLAAPITARAGALLPHRFTLAGVATGNALLCGPIPPVTRPGCYPARCPVERGLSSGVQARPRPLGVLGRERNGITFCAGIQAARMRQICCAIIFFRLRLRKFLQLR